MTKRFLATVLLIVAGTLLAKGLPGYELNHHSSDSKFLGLFFDENFLDVHVQSSLWVEVVQVRLEGRERPGYRVSIAQKPDQIKEALRSHFGKLGKKPVIAGEHILFEKVPLTEASSIDLFYHIQQKNSEQSTCTLVGLDSRRRALSGGYKPELTRSLLSAWDSWLYPLTGKHLTYSHLLPNAKKSSAAYQDTIAILKAGIYAYEDLMEEQEFLIDSLLRAVRRNPNRRRAVNIPLAKSTAEAKMLQDSLYSIKTKSRKVNQLLIESNRRFDSLYNEIRVQDAFLVQLDQSQKRLNSTLQKIESLEGQLGQQKAVNQEQKSRLATLSSQVREAESAVSGNRKKLLSKLRRAENQLADLERRLVHSQREIRKDRHYIFALSEEKKNIQAQKTDLRSAMDSLRQRVEVAEGMAIGLTRRTVTLQTEIDSLRGSLHTLGAEKRALLANRDSLLTEIDLLGPYSREARARRHVYQEQLAILQDLERRLPAREQALHAMEKLLQQREKYIIQTDKTGSYLYMKQLLDSLTIAHESLKAKMGGGGQELIAKYIPSKEVYMSTLAIKEEVYPAFCLEREYSGLAIRERLIDYFREKMRLAPSSRDPLTFQSVRLPGAENQRLTLTFSVSEQLSTGLRRISCTFRLAGGDYLGPYSDESIQAEAKNLLMSILP